ncbi:MAG: hypothetical protein U0271_10005 [Polyangiaceae bacterium]
MASALLVLLPALELALVEHQGAPSITGLAATAFASVVVAGLLVVASPQRSRSVRATLAMCAAVLLFVPTTATAALSNTSLPRLLPHALLFVAAALALGLRKTSRGAWLGPLPGALAIVAALVLQLEIAVAPELSLLPRIALGALVSGAVFAASVRFARVPTLGAVVLLVWLSAAMFSAGLVESHAIHVSFASSAIAALVVGPIAIGLAALLERSRYGSPPRVGVFSIDLVKAAGHVFVVLGPANVFLSATRAGTSFALAAAGWLGALLALGLTFVWVAPRSRAFWASFSLAAAAWTISMFFNEATPSRLGPWPLVASVATIAVVLDVVGEIARRRREAAADAGAGLRGQAYATLGLGVCAATALAPSVLVGATLAGAALVGLARWRKDAAALAFGALALTIPPCLGVARAFGAGESPLFPELVLLGGVAVVTTSALLDRRPATGAATTREVVAIGAPAVVLVVFGVVMTFNLAHDLVHGTIELAAASLSLGVGLFFQRRALVRMGSVAIAITVLVEYFGKLAGRVHFGVLMLGFGVLLIAFGWVYERRLRPAIHSFDGGSRPYRARA